MDNPAESAPLGPAAARAQSGGGDSEHAAVGRPQPPLQSHRTPPGHLLSAALGAWLLAALLVTAFLWHERTRVFDHAAHDAGSMTALMEAHTVNTLQAVDLALIEIAGKLADGGLPRHDPALRQAMQQRLAGMPYVRALYVIGPDGFIQHDTDYPNTPDVSLADRDYFVAHVRDPGLEHVFSSSILSRSVGTWFMASTRRVGTGDPFRGIVVAAVRSDYFDDLYGRIGAGEGQSMALFHRDGRLLAQHPRRAGEVGRSYVQAPLFTAHLEREPSGLTVGVPGGFCAIDCLLSYATVRGAPLVVTLALDTGELLAGWRRVAWIATAALLALLLAMALATVFVMNAQAQRQRQRERQAQGEKMEALGLLTGSIAHDFANLLGIVSGSLELLRRSVQLGGRPAAALDRAERAVANGARMTQQLLSLARKRELAMVPIDLREVVRSALPLLQQAAGSGIRVETPLAPDRAVARVDRSQLEVALINLVVNARDAMQGRGRIVVGVAPADRTVRKWLHQGAIRHCADVSVRDDGPGMPESVRRRAFEPFFTTKGEAGTGLGLPQVYALVQQLGGEVEIDSRPGQGTTVHLLLPLIDADADADAEVGAGDA